MNRYLWMSSDVLRKVVERGGKIYGQQWQQQQADDAKYRSVGVNVMLPHDSDAAFCRLEQT